MKFSDKTVEAAFALAMTGCVEAQVGDPEGLGAAWQGLVKLERMALTLNGVADAHYKYVKPGHTTMVWLADENGTIICVRSEDCDTAGYKERVESIRREFADVVRYYNQPPDLSVFGDDEFAVNDFDDFDFEQEVG